MSYLNRMRVGDTIISKRGREFEVQSVDLDSATARDVVRPNSTREFNARDLEEVDDGLWQEMEGR